MDKNKFDALLPLIVAALMQKIVEQKKISQDEAFSLVYNSAHNLNGKTAFDVFQKYKIFDYITSYYDVLHSFGRLYIINEIDDYIAQREPQA